MPDTIQIMRGLGKKQNPGGDGEVDVPLWLLTIRGEEDTQIAIPLEGGSLAAIGRLFEAAEDIALSETVAWSGRRIPTEPSQADVVEETTKGAHATAIR